MLQYILSTIFLLTLIFTVIKTDYPRLLYKYLPSKYIKIVNLIFNLIIIGILVIITTFFLFGDINWTYNGFKLI